MGSNGSLSLSELRSAAVIGNAWSGRSRWRSIRFLGGATRSLTNFARYSSTDASPLPDWSITVVVTGQGLRRQAGTESNSEPFSQEALYSFKAVHYDTRCKAKTEFCPGCTGDGDINGIPCDALVSREVAKVAEKAANCRAPFGRIVELLYSRDSMARSAKLQTARGLVARSVRSLVLLEPGTA
ncbi:hypothetical protein T4D_7772 [Trichinella pseudospiralis]|uniref:Uncharacterized protein n=1 Tax=Trichinella pseudospiralis TaxID=6337 RepID=A0A0V1FBT1_TRIPS|nr:hypothetical protein T4D_7772 [Trichinella pseudospiralis]